jgi:hypothetical protein
MYCLPERTALLGALALLGEQLEGALLGLVAGLGQASEGLLAGCSLLAADNASALVQHQILASQAAGSVLCSAVEDLCLATSSHHAASHVLHFSVVGHLFLPEQHIFFVEGRFPSGNHGRDHFLVQPRFHGGKFGVRV